MTKKKKGAEKTKPMNPETQVNFDPFQYGYKPGSAVTIPVELFMRVIDLTGAVAKNEVKERIEVLSVELGAEVTEQQKPIVRVFTTPVGRASEELFNEFLNVHVENIEKGLAVDLNTPTLDLGDDSK